MQPAVNGLRHEATESLPSKQHAPEDYNMEAESVKRGSDSGGVIGDMKCPNCGVEIEPDARKCGGCQNYLKSELECLRSIDASVGIMKRILIWWLVVSFFGGVLYLVTKLR
jgi:predicted nucleic acid-binding Zn ribbon protein